MQVVHLMAQHSTFVFSPKVHLGGNFGLQLLNLLTFFAGAISLGEKHFKLNREINKQINAYIIYIYKS